MWLIYIPPATADLVRDATFDSNGHLTDFSGNVSNFITHLLAYLTKSPDSEALFAPHINRVPNNIQHIMAQLWS